MRRVWGFDPGTQTGFAHVEIGAQAPYRVVALSAFASGVAFWSLAGWRDPAQVGPRPDLIVIETWEYQGRARARGIASQAYATGTLAGAVDVLGFPFTLIRRSEVLVGLGLARNADKHRVRLAVGAFVGAKALAGASEHAVDALAAAIVGAGRIPVIPALDKHSSM